VQATTIEDQNAFAPSLCFGELEFHMTDVKTRVMRLRVIESPNAHDQIVSCAFHSFLVECWLHICDTCIITTWRLGLQATKDIHDNPSNLNSEGK